MTAKESKLTPRTCTRDSKLSRVCALLLEWAIRNPTRRRAFEPLAGGLLVKLYLDHSGLCHVLLARKGDKGPSGLECRTVVAHWPEPVPAGVGWTAFERAPYQCSVAVWRPGAPAAAQLPLSEASHAAD